MTDTIRLTKADYVKLMIEESADLADYLADLAAPDWDAQTLCAGWRVRHVVSHMAVGHTMAMGPFLRTIVASRGVEQASHRLALRYGDSHSPAEILALFRAGTTDRPRGPAGFVAPAELFIDHLIHHQDIRRPLGHSRVIPAHRLATALDVLPRLGGLLKPRRRVRGLCLVAEDIGRRVGEGAEVRGTAEALIMCAGGRAAPLPELSGPGAAILASRIGGA
ncbi:maleylpyruvate isomerase family mycothiol-dependent enzyme [Phytohabitans rumicis]|uniref:Mycothiol-dependent maleylpyruvate isomerase metal-binding domain-containing protein n=1 Tax=Phytohabitans rumicis TaxID=1076125 RepID=A0A6V8LAM5_9ACTN|nr:maleylpyruvate isomerase family mycothiol-dependent enzyme [Phytohabitans rumicis]GFJ91599.1 hypothetical protein Prum_052410 [Phytohabitans rumicis]